SWVGPSPPVVTMRSAPCRAREMPALSVARWSPSMETCCSSMPNAGSRAASQALLASVSSPMSNSVPMAKISAFIHVLHGLYGDESEAQGCTIARAARHDKRGAAAHAAPCQGSWTIGLYAVMEQ